MGPFGDVNDKDDEATQEKTQETTQEATQEVSQKTLVNFADDISSEEDFQSLPSSPTLPRLKTPPRSTYKKIMKMLEEERNKKRIS